MLGVALLGIFIGCALIELAAPGGGSAILVCIWVLTEQISGAPTDPE
jgi:hypothetical protein